MVKTWFGFAAAIFLAGCAGWDEVPEPSAPELGGDEALDEFGTVTGAVAKIDVATASIHDYADECMCQLGGRKAYRMPDDIVWNGPNTHEVYVYWNKKRITWGIPKGGVKEQFLFDGLPAAKDFPEVGVAGELTDPTGVGLKCDHVPFVETSCIPGQRLYQKTVDGVTWTAIFRRRAAATLKAASDGKWDQFDAEYFKVVDVQAWKVGEFPGAAAGEEATGGVCWFDSVGTKAMTNETRARSAEGKPKAVPRPGGRNASSPKGITIKSWFDTPAVMAGPDGDCGNCHGNGPMLGSDWLREGLKHEIDRGTPIDFGKGKELYWNAWELLEKKTFFSGAAKAGVSVFANVANGTACDSCHTLWAAKSGTTPGGRAALAALGKGSKDISAFMTTNYLDNALYSRYRRERDLYDATVGKGMPPLKPAEAALALNADITHAMPRTYSKLGKGFTVKQWEDDYKDALVELAACNAATVAAPKVPSPSGGMLDCTDVVEATPPTFFGAHEAKPKAAGQLQRIQAPDEPLTMQVKLVVCDPAKPPPKDEPWKGLCYRVTWEDPNDEWTAPVEYYLTEDTYGADADAKDVKVAGEYCPSGGGAKANLVKAYDAGFPKLILGSEWRFRYQITKPLDKCTAVSVRVCGGWCKHLSKSKGAVDSAQNMEGCPPPMETDTVDFPDVLTPDAWDYDASPPDVWDYDVSPPDVWEYDASPPDVWEYDAQPSDAWKYDALTPDASWPDAGPYDPWPDASWPDAGPHDPWPDATWSDAVTPDVATPNDAGGPPSDEVTVPCCAQPVPKTLEAEFAPGSPCAGKHSLVWDGGAWRGGEGPFAIDISCIGPGPEDWYVQVDSAAAQPTTAVCEPLELAMTSLFTPFCGPVTFSVGAATSSEDTDTLDATTPLDASKIDAFGP